MITGRVLNVTTHFARAAIFVLAVLAPLFATSGGESRLRAQGSTHFIEANALRGVDVNTPAALSADYGSGVAFVDFDNDDDLDLYVAMGHSSPNRLYRLDDDAMRFDDVADALGCADPGSGKGVKFADYDNDGDQDLFIANFRNTNRLYQNQGGGAFVDVTADAGMVFADNSHGAAWADYDKDGWLDLYVCLRTRDAADLLYHNNGDGTFTNVSPGVGVGNIGRLSFECVWTDYDRDGDEDLYIAVDKRRGNKLYRNDGDGTFTDVSTSSGAEVFIDGMGIAVGDFNNDGWEDLYITNTNPGHVLLFNARDGTFRDVAGAWGVQTFRYGWGTEFFDYDNDGDLDLYVVHWSFTPGLPEAGNILYRKDAGRFTDVSAEAGVGDTGSGFGLAVGDYTGDGYMDMFVQNRNGPSRLFENTLSGNAWLEVKTIGRMGRVDPQGGLPASNRDGLGARVVVLAGATGQTRVIRSGSSFLSMSSRNAHFGMGDFTVADKVTVTWPSGVTDEFENVPLNQTLVVCEGGWPIEFKSVHADASAGSVDLAWTLRCEGRTSGFQLFRKRATETGFDPAIHVATLDASTRQWTDRSVEQGVTYQYYVSATGPGADAVSSGPVEATVPSARYLQLRQNVPNPFTPQTTITYGLENAGPVRLAVYDARGTLVDVLVNRVVGPGEHEYVWSPVVNGRALPSGPYFLRLETPGGELTRKMVLLR